MKITEKIWGERWLMHEDTTHTTNVLHLKKGYKCSLHYHRTKWNLFVVLEGMVGIKTDKGEKMLHVGEEMRIAPGEMHEFRVYEDGVMIEIMYVEYDDDDIERVVLGSKMEDVELKEGRKQL